MVLALKLPQLLLPQLLLQVDLKQCHLVKLVDDKEFLSMNYPKLSSKIVITASYVFVFIQFSQEYNLDGLGSIDKMVLDYLQLPSSL